jgi:hypothetical protein
MFKLIVPLNLLKDDQTCYKITGEKPYRVKRKIHINEQIIECDKSSVFLVDNSGFTKSFSENTEVKYLCEDISDIEDMYLLNQ